MGVHRSNRNQRISVPYCLLTIVLLTSCAGPAPSPIDPEAVAASVAERKETPSEVILAAIALHDAPPLGLEFPEGLDPKRDAGRDVFWHAHAIAFAPSVRTSRRAWRALREEAGGAGTPDRTSVLYKNEELPDSAHQDVVAASVDLLGLLGIGPKAAEKELATRIVGQALGELEEEVWRSVFAVDRARVHLAAVRWRESVLRKLVADAYQDMRRLELLDKRGRLADGLLGRVRASLAGLDAQVANLHTLITRRREEVARRSGLTPDAPAMDAIEVAILLGSGGPLAAAPSPIQLLDTLPVLRSAHLAYAVAEAQVRAAAAAAWPRLRIGPHLKIRADTFLSGGVVSLDFPWPTAVAAGIQAAIERREASREKLEDILAGVLVTIAARQQEHEIATVHHARHAKVQKAGSARAWRAARARLSIEEDAHVVENWLDAVHLRARGLIAEVDATEHARISDLSYREAAGLRPGLEPEGDR